MRYANEPAESVARPSGPGCPSYLAGPASWAQSVPEILVTAWSVSLGLRASLGPLALAFILTPVISTLVAAEVVLYIAVVVLRGNCTVEGIAASQVSQAKLVLGVLRPLLPGDLRDVVDAVLDVLSGKADVGTLCGAAKALLPFLPEEIRAQIPPLPSCPSPTPQPVYVVSAANLTYTALEPAQVAEDEDEGSGWLIAAGVFAALGAVGGLAFAFRRKRRKAS